MREKVARVKGFLCPSFFHTFFHKWEMLVIAAAFVAFLFAAETSLAVAATSQDQEVQKIHIGDIPGLIKSQNLAQMENAVRLRQAQETISVARGELLPKLNLFRILGFELGATGIIGLTPDLLPFLIPANWFRVDEVKLLAQAQAEAFRAFLANQIHQATELFLQIELDSKLLALEKLEADKLYELMELARTREAFGQAPKGTRLLILENWYKKREDILRLEALVFRSKAQMALLLNLKPNQVLEFASEISTDSEKDGKYNGLDFATAISPSDQQAFFEKSYEFQQLVYLDQVNDKILKSLKYVLFGVSDLSRGIAGEMFERIPVQDGWGFGTGASRRIVELNKSALKLQRQVQQATYFKTHVLIVADFEREENASPLRVQALSDSQTLLEYYNNLSVVSFPPVPELVDALGKNIHARQVLVVSEHMKKIASERLKRLRQRSPYSRDELGGS